MDFARKRLDDLAHAHWRVRFLKNLFEVHRSIPQRSSYDWLLQEADYMQRIALAERELANRTGTPAGHHVAQWATG
ncbi:MAG TPA: hypothetical protein VLE43_00635 [Candidatus Saccharimonadia bacterium]|nr:hypothetical protein [Candidatus Saccharimonadia bacterium]